VTNDQEFLEDKRQVGERRSIRGPQKLRGNGRGLLGEKKNGEAVKGLAWQESKE